jgi:kinesin family member 22
MSASKTSVKAYIRIRAGDGAVEYTKNTVLFRRDAGERVEYTFDAVFGPNSTQEDIFEELREAVARFMEGRNLTVFCYGNTGAGKTYTMMGTKDAPGLMCNIVREILRCREFLVSYMEIYNEKIYDLLEPRELMLREFNKTIVVQNIYSRRIRSMEEFSEALVCGARNRTTGETRLNKNSSRSHAILRISMGEHKLHLIDLAGSENNRKTGNEGVRLEESANINRSLFVLGKVVSSILRAESRIPYRDSKLTRLLQDCLGGSSLCYIIANVVDDPEFLGETQSTLAFASKSRSIVNYCERAHAIAGKPLMPKNKESKSIVSYCEKAHATIGKPLIPSNSLKAGIRFRKISSGEGKENFGGKGAPAVSVKKSKRVKEGNSSSLLRNTVLEAPDVLLTPRTKEKSYKAFLRRAQELEAAQKYKLALEDYKAIQKFCDSSFIRDKIESISRGLRGSRTKLKPTAKEALDILNRGKLFEVRKLPCIGDKRAQAIVDFVSGGNLFESLSDLRLLFSEKIVEAILGGSA